MHTGNEGVIDHQGHCRVTGRIKDLIIRGKLCSILDRTNKAERSAIKSREYRTSRD